MKKSFGVYSLIWLIVLAVFNVIVFVTPHEVAGVSKFTPSFWVGYAAITVVFAVQLLAAFFALRAKNLKTMFYKIPLISISYTGLIVMLIAGGLFLALPQLPTWIGIILCTVILAFNLVAIIKATAAAALASGVDTKVRVKTAFIRNLTIDAQNLVNTAASEPLRAEAKAVWDAVRYSDPMSDDALIAIEAQISTQFRDFSAAVAAEDAEMAKQTAATLLSLIENRAQRCRALK